MPRTKIWFITALVILSSFLFFSTLLPFAAQEELDVESVSMDPERMLKYLDAEGEKLSQEAWKRINTAEKLENSRENIHREFLFMIGLDPLPPRTPLKMTQVRKVEREEYTIDVLHYQSLPGFYVTANLYRPKKVKALSLRLYGGPDIRTIDTGPRPCARTMPYPGSETVISAWWSIRSRWPRFLVYTEVRIPGDFTTGIHAGIHQSGSRFGMRCGQWTISRAWTMLMKPGSLLTESRVEGI